MASAKLVEVSPLGRSLGILVKALVPSAKASGNLIPKPPACTTRIGSLKTFLP